LNQVKRLVAVETEEMYNARKQQKEQHKALRPPIVISHQLQPAEAIKSASGEVSH
jgi:large subunit ribosomal protein L30